MNSRFKEEVYFSEDKRGNCLIWAIYYKLRFPTKVKLKIEKGFWVESLKKGRIPHVYWYDKRYNKFYHFRHKRYTKEWYKFYFYKGQIDQKLLGIDNKKK